MNFKFLKIAYDIFGGKTGNCYVMQGKMFSSKYKNGNKPIPLADVYCIHLVAARIHGVKGHSLDLYTREQFQKQGKSIVSLFDSEDKGFWEVIEFISKKYDVPNDMIKSYRLYQTEVTLIYLENEVILNIETQ